MTGDIGRVREGVPMSAAMRTISAMSIAHAEEEEVAGGTGGHLVEVRPDASVLGAIGRGHSLASALADLIDNAVDAGAAQVEMRFVTRDSRVRSVQVVDDGCGMTRTQLEAALTLGRRREHSATDLGYFGVGLKAASFSQAGTLTVYSASGHSPAAAMRMGRDQSGESIRAEAFDSDVAESVTALRGLGGESGTVVEWTGLDAVSVATSTDDRRRWFEATIADLRAELGLTFHRLISEGVVSLRIIEVDEPTGESGAPRTVQAIDPFAFHASGAAGYPKTLDVDLGGSTLSAECFILPPGADGPAIRLLGRPRKTWQGLYVYRNGRLLHGGGWCGLHADGTADLQLARVRIDLDEDALDAVAINAEKKGVILRPEALQAFGRASTDGFRLHGYWADVREAWRRSQSRKPRPNPVAAPGDGVPEQLARAVETTLGIRADDGVAFSFDWADLPDGQLFRFEPSTATVRLATAHREHLEGRPDLLAVLKTSIFFLFEEYAGRERFAQPTQARLDTIQAVIAEAIIGAPTDEGAELAVEAPSAEAQVASGSSALQLHEPDLVEALSDPRVAHVVVRGALDDFGARAKRTELLTAEEEVDLARRIEVGVLAEARLAEHPSPIPTREERRDYIVLVRDGQRAYDRMITANLRLVISIARKHRGQGLDIEDLVQEGNAGLIHAVQKFDFAHGTKFSTYATWWIRQSIMRAIADQGRLIRFPVHVVDKLRRIRDEWRTTSGPHTERLRIVAQSMGESVGLVRAAMANDRPPLSLDAEVIIEAADAARRAVPLGEVLEDGQACGPEELADAVMLSREVESLLRPLTERERDVIRMRYGLDRRPPMTLEQIGELLGLTRERIRQIEVKVMRGLRDSRTADPLREFVGLVGVESDAAAVEEDRSGDGRTSKRTRIEKTARGMPSTSMTATTVVGVGSAGGTKGMPAAVFRLSVAIDVLTLYGQGLDIGEVAARASVSPREVAWILAERLVGLSVYLDDKHRFSRAGEPLTEEEELRVRTEAAAGVPWMTIARLVGRTPLAIAMCVFQGPDPPRDRTVIARALEKVSRQLDGR